MNCTKTKENTDLFFDDELDSAQRQRIEKHLAECHVCGTELENLRAIRKSVRQNLPVSAPASLDAKIMSAFQNFHDKKPVEKIAVEKKSVWFGIPRFALAAAAVLFVLTTITAFKIGEMSAGKISVVMPEIRDNQISTVAEIAEPEPEKTPSSAQVKIVEVPVVREKIVKVPLIKTRTVYIDKKKNPSPNALTNENYALKSSIEDNGYLTRTDLKEFQPVSEFKIKINKEEK